MKSSFLHMLLLLIVTVSLGLSFSTVSNAEMFQDTTSHDSPADDETDETELEIEVNETISMIHELPFRFIPLSGQSIIFDVFAHLSDNYIHSIDIPPLC